MAYYSDQVSLNIEEDSPTESVPRAPLHRADPYPRHMGANRDNLGFGDRLNNVFREIRPLMENARMGNNPRLSLPTWLPRYQPGITGEYLPRPQSSAAHLNSAPPTYYYSEREDQVPNSVISHSESNESNSTESNQTQPQPEVSAAGNPANNNNINDNVEIESQSDDAHQVVDMRSTINILVRYAPFYLILFIKLMYDCREGIFTFILLVSIFGHGNNLVRREHGKQMNRSIFLLFCELVFSISSILIIHYFFGHGKLLPNVIMFPGYTEPIDVWELIWLVVLTDLFVRIITVDIKIMITMLPAFILPFQKRGKVYLFTEAISQLYRTLLAIQPWVYFLTGSYQGSEKMVGMLLLSIYVICKVIEILFRLRLFKTATWTLLQSVNLGTKPTREQLLTAGESCPICHDEYTTPVRLGCSHIFCELCIAAWLDREYTCPLCRAKVADEPTWRDGTTTFDFQVY